MNKEAEVEELKEWTASQALCLEESSATQIIQWAAEKFDDGMVMTASFQDAILIDLIAKHAPATKVVFLDTQYHFPETLQYRDLIAAKYELDLEVLSPEITPDKLWQRDTDACCAARKVEPLKKALADKTAWISGIRRSQTANRLNTPIVSWDETHRLVKISPIATWADEDIERYRAENQVPQHPLTSLGFLSIGCWPCTKPVNPGEDARSGRWANTNKSECGLHTKPLTTTSTTV